MKSIKAIGVGLLAAATLATAATAHADTIPYGELLGGLCAQVDANPSVQTLSDLVSGAAAVGWPREAESTLMRRAVNQICPQHLALLNHWANMAPAPVGWYGRVANFPPFNPAWMNIR